jgi:hypothetical protein
LGLSPRNIITTVDLFYLEVASHSPVFILIFQSLLSFPAYLTCRRSVGLLRTICHPNQSICGLGCLSKQAALPGVFCNRAPPHTTQTSPSQLSASRITHHFFILASPASMDFVVFA